MRFHFRTLLAVLVFVLFGCGGGGAGGNTGFQSRQDSFTVAANQASSQLFGEIGVEISAGTYPGGAQLTLKQSAQASQMPPTTNFKLGKPALELSSNATATKDVVVTIPDDGKQYIAGIEVDGEWLPLRSEKANGRINFTLPTNFGRSSEDGPGQIWRWVIGLVKDNLSDTEYAIKRLEGSTNFGDPGTILCLHGILDNWQSMSKFADPALAKLGGSSVFSFAFPWKQGAKAAGIELAALLAPYRHQLKNITIIGYSQGVLTARHALERLGATASVKDCIYLMGPNLGSSLANRVDFAFNIGKFWLNASVSGSPFDIDVDDPAIKEFKPGNPFLDELNSYHGTQRGDVDYYVLNGENDWVVDANSGQAIGVRLEELIGGMVWRGTVPGATHFNIKSDVSVINRMFDMLPLVFGGELTIIFEPPTEVNAQLDGWDFSFRVRNNTPSPIQYKDLGMETYSRDSQSYATQWYDRNTPNGTFFPLTYASWNETLGAGQTSDPIAIRLSPDWDGHNINEVPINMQAKTAVFILNATQNGRPVKTKANLICYYGDIRPEPPNTRARPEKDNRLGTISAVRPPR